MDAQSYFVETIGNTNEEVIRAYVLGQLKGHKEKENIPKGSTSSQTQILSIFLKFNAKKLK